MAVMDYANEGNLRECLTKIIEKNWKQRLEMLYRIIKGLDEIHKRKLIHRDLHDGNILNHNDNQEYEIFISDLGLCCPIQSFLKKDSIYGVVPFMAPEVIPIL